MPPAGMDNMEKWKTTHPDSWTPDDVMSWVTFLATNLDGDSALQKLHLENFKDINGWALRGMSRDELERLDLTYGGYIHVEFQKLWENSKTSLLVFLRELERERERERERREEREI